MARGGRDKRREGPERRCILTGARAPADALIRFAVGPDGTIVPDIVGSLPGRGFWLAPAPGAIGRAAKKGHFARAARAKVHVPAELAEATEAQLAQRVVSLLSLARKGGGAVAGFEKTRLACTNDAVAALIQARDGAPRGLTKLRPPAGAAHVTCLTGQEIGLAFGRGYVIHAALKVGGLAPRIVVDAARLAALRGDRSPPAPAAPGPGAKRRCGDA